MTSSQRIAVVAEAESWLGTKYHDHGRVKQAGADCAMMPLDVYVAVLGMVAPPLPKYVQQFNLHRNEEMYLEYVRACGAIQITEADVLPGDFGLWHMGRCYSHGAIITAWPEVIHAVNPRGVIRDDAVRSPNMAFSGALTPPLFFTF